ncbi:phosphotriesterase-related protein [Nocardioides sp. J9]|uniref:phosphotriesterase family protein n=1 Tax=unclassified Nocardioides TaxID=2615069 RepID=UPI00048D44B7|nr:MULTISPECIES: phosphotriesterase [unclassified Nocardioides]TWH02681.1 phosphotriesterase-related protein [Nocardioides sp. J9]
MTTIPTITGEIGLDDLGRTLVHEHVFVLGEEYRINYQDDWDEEEQVERAVAALEELRGLGFDTIMDPTVLGLGRYIPRIQRIAERTSLQILAATGLYTFNDVPHQFHYRGPGLMFDGPEPLTELFVKDLTVGIADTGVRAAFLKCAIDEPGLTPGVERVMRAVGQASVQTGAPITVHTNAATQSGLVAQKVLADEGVDLRKVIVGHSGDSDDLDYLVQLADAGSLLGMDRFGLDPWMDTERRIDVIVELVRRGYAESIVLSHDAHCFMDFVPEDQLVAALPNWNYVHIPRDVLPALLEKGVTEAQLETMLVANVRRHFS